MSFANVSFNVATGANCNCCGGASNCCFTNYSFTVGGAADITSNNFTATNTNATAFTYAGDMAFANGVLFPYAADIFFDSHLNIAGPAWLNVSYTVTSSAGLDHGATMTVTGPNGPITPDAENQGANVASGYANYTLADTFCYVLNMDAVGFFDTATRTLSVDATAISNANIC